MQPDYDHDHLRSHLEDPGYGNYEPQHIDHSKRYKITSGIIIGFAVIGVYYSYTNKQKITDLMTSRYGSY